MPCAGASRLIIRVLSGTFRLCMSASISAAVRISL